MPFAFFREVFECPVPTCQFVWVQPAASSLQKNLLFIAAQWDHWGHLLHPLLPYFPPFPSFLAERRGLRSKRKVSGREHLRLASLFMAMIFLRDLDGYPHVQVTVEDCSGAGLRCISQNPKPRMRLVKKMKKIGRMSQNPLLFCGLFLHCHADDPESLQYLLFSHPQMRHEHWNCLIRRNLIFFFFLSPCEELLWDQECQWQQQDQAEP